MKEKIIEAAQKGVRTEEKLNLLREELHHLILQETDRKGGFAKVCFLGGTSLRVVFGLDRFSEDLDFSLAAGQRREDFDLEPLLLTIQKSLDAYGLECQLKKFKKTGAVHSGLFTFEGGLLHTIDRAYHPKQKLYIKFDVDTNPPRGGVEEVSPVAGARLYKVRHYDLTSLFAGKLHALLFRVYTKGRDLYDFLWYVGKKVRPNKTLLENAIEQTQKKSLMMTDELLIKMLKDRFEKIDFLLAQKDVAPFLTDRQALTLFERDVFMGAVEKISL